MRMKSPYFSSQDLWLPFQTLSVGDQVSPPSGRFLEVWTMTLLILFAWYNLRPDQRSYAFKLPMTRGGDPGRALDVCSADVLS